MKKIVIDNVVGVNRCNARTLLKLESKTIVDIPYPKCYVKPKQKVKLVFNNNKLVEATKILETNICPHDPFTKLYSNDNIVKLYPPFRKNATVSLPPFTLHIEFKEPITKDEWNGMKFLERFHYRGKGFEKIPGRRIVIIAKHHENVIGYGVLAATLPACSPRFKIFNLNFKKQMRYKLINRLIRIPRVVIHPEYRSIGLGVKIVQALIEYAKNYWDINGYKPIAIEVIAKMAEYHTFFELAGFKYVGNTYGYKDTPFTPIYTGKNEWEERKNWKKYNFMSNQKPKPYLIYPLTNGVKKLLDKVKYVKKEELKFKKSKGGKITFKNVSVTFISSLKETNRTNEVKDAFGIDSECFKVPVLSKINLTINPGEIVLITGASGSGKSTLLKFFMNELKESNIKISGKICGLDGLKISKLSFSWKKSLPLIEQIGKDENDAIYKLNMCGLTEAYLYMKKPQELSEGQKYRFAIAKLFDSGSDIWIIDEFAQFLDPLTAAIVAKGLRKMAKISDATVIVAAAHVNNFYESLRPDKIVHLSWGGKYKIYNYEEYKKTF